MLKRGDVVRLQQRVGFGPKGQPESVVIVQATQLIRAVPTVLVVPLDPAVELRAGDPRCIRVPAGEAGGREYVAVVTGLRPLRLDSLAPTVYGALSRSTTKALERAMRLVLAL